MLCVTQAVTIAPAGVAYGQCRWWDKTTRNKARIYVDFVLVYGEGELICLRQRQYNLPFGKTFAQVG